MKYLFFLLPLLLISCSPTTYNAFTETYVFDFTPYTNQGFLITPLDYQLNEYESIAFIDLKHFPGNHLYNKEDMSLLHNFVADNPIKFDSLLNVFYLKAKYMGANAIIRFKFETQNEVINGIGTTGLYLSGYAIKRDKK